MTAEMKQAAIERQYCDGLGYCIKGTNGTLLTRLHVVLAPECEEEFDTAPDCECPHEHWHVGRAGACLVLHIEDDGSGHIVLDWGDDSRSLSVTGVRSLDELRDMALGLVRNMQER